jgi:glyoxylase-like metal-dependent hydrolase (beta-lactamase superfamily II)
MPPTFQFRELPAPAAARFRVGVLPVGPIEANCTLVLRDGAPADAVLLDPGDDAPAILAALAALRVTPSAILLTHGHMDHTGALAAVADAFPAAAVWLHPLDAAWYASPVNAIPGLCPPPPPLPANRLSPFPADGAPLPLPGWDIRPHHTPGHTPGGVCWHFPAIPALFSGDTLFRDSVGRTDLPGGDPRALAASLATLSRYPAETLLFPGHGDPSTLDRERRCNYFLQEPPR